jgi:hypothetical protein
MMGTILAATAAGSEKRMSEEPLPELLQAFRNAAARHYEATVSGDHEVANRNADVVEETFARIIGLGVAGREGLLSLLNDNDKAVVLKAATHSLKYEPTRCEKVIRQISKEAGVIGFIAQQALKRWKEGNLNFG